MKELDFREVVFIDDDESYFERFSSFLKENNLRYFPQERSSFYKIRSEVNMWGRCTDVGSFNELKRVIDFFVNENTVCIVDFQLIEGIEFKYNGLKFYEDFIKGKNKRTIFVSATMVKEEIDMIEKFCSENKNCFFVHKPPHSYSRSNKERFEAKIKELILK